MLINNPQDVAESTGRLGPACVHYLMQCLLLHDSTLGLAELVVRRVIRYLRIFYKINNGNGVARGARRALIRAQQTSTVADGYCTTLFPIILGAE